MSLEAVPGLLIPLVIRFGINLVAMTALIYGMYYRRYQNKELVTAAALFNVFVFAVLQILSSVEFSVAAGFGLFAILALFTLRSEAISKTEITYFFGSIAIAVICSVQGTTLPFVLTTLALVLAGAYVLDHPRMLQSVDSIKIMLDQIDQYALSDPKTMKESLSKRLGVKVNSYQILSFDYVNERAQINVNFRKPREQASPIQRQIMEAVKNETVSMPTAESRKEI